MKRALFRRHAATALALAAPFLVFSLTIAGCSTTEEVESTPQAAADSRDVRDVAPDTDEEAAAMAAFHQELRDAGYSFTKEQQEAIDDAAPKSCGMASFLHAPDYMLVDNLPTYMRTHHDMEIGQDAARTVWQAAKKHVCGKISED